MRDVQTARIPGSEAGPGREWLSWLDGRREAVNRLISGHLAALKSGAPPHSRLAESVEYSLGQGGKRLRPILVLEACGVCGGSEERAVAAALAVECVHTFSLVHDDLPAMDDDDLRRGVATNHKVFGEAVAVLAGDWLLGHAFELLSGDRVEAGIRGPLAAALARGTLGMISGQGADIDSEGLPPEVSRVEYIHAHKTAALTEACCVMGARCASGGDEAVESMGRYGRHLGFAFQIADDLLDRTSTAAVLGKRAGKDAGAAKQTYPAACGVDESRARAKREIDEALDALRDFGAAADNLRGLARFVIARDR